MNTYVALLRGINVGGNSKVDMKKLKALFESLGYSDVSTYINSGNVIFSSKDLSEGKIDTKLEKAMEKEFGFRIPVVIRTKDSILKLAKAIPKEWTNGGDQKTDILFLWADFDTKDSLKLLEPVKGVDTLKYVQGAIIWNLNRELYNKSSMRKFIGTTLYKNMTARNVNTVRKLAALLQK